MSLFYTALYPGAHGVWEAPSFPLVFLASVLTLMTYDSHSTLPSLFLFYFCSIFFYMDNNRTFK